MERNIQSTTDGKRSFIYWNAKHVSDPYSASLDATTIIHRTIGINLATTIVKINENADNRSLEQLSVAKAIFLIAQRRLSTNGALFNSIDDSVLLIQRSLVEEYLAKIEDLRTRKVLQRAK